ncbi:EAL domain-containing protein [Sphingomonas radiodurans]|uniref:EAL domain-containing protein n=1 Tax=Sphingomonas radiodurans TaxID=2890321 RepID=UPI001E50E576|nr:EAL domain-containing protein [Sphingomonas radiodurans]WBH15042.1 EAL domain-containing protein [Sphingomonas radiodurans]
MDRGASPIRIFLTARAAPWVMLLGVLVIAGFAGSQSASVALILISFASVVWISQLQRIVRVALPRPGETRRGGEADPEVSVAGLEQQLQSLRHRIAEVHPVSGLPVREGLVERITADGQGLLGIIAFTDFDRLSAFDPTLADRVFAQCSARLRTMIPSDRYLAQIDRGHIGVWFGREVTDVDAWAELDAISYALGEVVVDGDTKIIPQVAFRLAAHDADAGMSPATFITRALASLSLPANAAATAQPAIDQAEYARDRFALEQDLRQAIDRRELRLNYQPLIDASQGCINGAEALIRWDHPTRGLVPPGQFFPVIEAMGLAGEIGTWALNTALREARGWAATGLGRLRVAVNVSSLQLEGDDLPLLVQRTLQSHGVSASQLEIELTESVATSNAEHCRGIFLQLRAMGIKLAVDDFGTGYSGFSSLRTLAFDKIKIDREFVTDVDRRSDSQAICQSIIALGRGLGIRVLAEGVERHAEYEWLRRHGCHHFQGYYFGRPMAGDAFSALVRDRAALAALLAPSTGAAQIMERLTA